MDARATPELLSRETSIGPALQMSRACERGALGARTLRAWHAAPMVGWPICFHFLGDLLKQ
jgi:hypothetical protein